MRVHYPHGLLGPPVLNLAPKATTHLFAEMDQIATELRVHPQFVEADLQIAFYQLQRDRIGKLSQESWLYLFAVWCDRDRGQQVIDDARFDALCEERERLFSQRAALPLEQHAAVTEKIAAIGRELADCRSFSTNGCPPTL